MPLASRIKCGVQYGLSKIGYQLRPHSKSTNPMYETVQPYATYSPWLVDREFQACYQKVRANTLVDVLRCYELWQLVEQASKLSGAILEVGVWRGGTGALIAKRAALCGISDPVYLCDTFAGVVKAGAADSGYRGGEHADTSEQIVTRLLAELEISNVRMLKGVFPDETGNQVSAGSVRLCHIDVDVYQSAEDILRWVWDRLCPGGIVVYDDYGFETCDGITRHVDIQRSLPDRIVVQNINGHAIVIKKG